MSHITRTTESLASFLTPERIHAAAQRLAEAKAAERAADASQPVATRRNPSHSAALELWRRVDDACEMVMGGEGIRDLRERILDLEVENAALVESAEQLKSELEVARIQANSAGDQAQRLRERLAKAFEERDQALSQARVADDALFPAELRGVEGEVAG